MHLSAEAMPKPGAYMGALVLQQDQRGGVATCRYTPQKAEARQGGLLLKGAPEPLEHDLITSFKPH